MHTEEWLFPVPDSLVGAVVGVGKPGVPVRWKFFCLNRKAVVLAGQVATPGAFFQAGLVLGAMAEFELVGAGASSQCQNLMTEADAQERQVFFKQGSDGFYGPSLLRVTWSVRNDHSLRV